MTIITDRRSGLVAFRKIKTPRGVVTLTTTPFGAMREMERYATAGRQLPKRFRK